MTNIFSSLFGKNVSYKKTFHVSGAEYESIISNNRSFLNEVPDWIDEPAFEDSCFQYGVPDFIRGDLNKPINHQPTYTDLMVWLAQKHFQNVNYLEIGVSVGKNFYQIIKSLPQGHFTGFDIEEINPVLANKLEFDSEENWATPATSIKKKDSSLKRFNFKEKNIEYLSGDVWDENSWKKLSGRKYNLVFSDALHSAEAILFEFEMLVKYDLLADKFIIFWDDLHGKMKKAFLNIVSRYDKQYRIADVYLIQINGWIGQHEPKHPVGIISNFDLQA